jgi:hypothetical protein
VLVVDDEAENIWPNRGKSAICLVVLQRTRQIFGPDIYCPSKYLSQAPLRNKFEALLLEPNCSVLIHIDTVLEKAIFIILVTVDQILYSF